METFAIADSLRWVLGGALAAFVVVMYALSWWVRDRIESAEDFLVAGRRLSLGMASATLLATWFGAGTLLAAADEVRAVGLRGAALDPLGAGLCLLLAGLFFAVPLWEMRLLTVSDFFRRRFGPRSELVSALILVPSYFGWVAAQLVALAAMLQLFFGLDPRWGILLVAAVGTGYTLLGGMWSVTLTDAVQIALVLAGLAVLAVTTAGALGNGDALAGLARVGAETPAERLALVPTESAPETLGWIGVLAIGALGNLPGQDLLQRVFAARSARTARRACYLAGTGYLVFGAVPLFLALASGLLLPGDVDEAILPAMAHLFLSPPLTVIFILALTAAVFSTIDSAILSPASVLAQNVLAPWAGGRLGLLALNRWAVVVVALGSTAMAFAGEDAYSLLEDAYELTLVGLFVPLALGLWGRARGEKPALAAMAAGGGFWAVHYLLGWDVAFAAWPAAAAWGVPVGLPATAAALAAWAIFGRRSGGGDAAAGVDAGPPPLNGR